MPGGDFAAFRAQLSAPPSVAAGRCCSAIRARTARASSDCSATAESIADLGEEVLPGLHVREIEYLRREEWAVTAEDILFRRSKLGAAPAGGAPPTRLDRVARERIRVAVDRARDDAHSRPRPGHDQLALDPVRSRGRASSPSRSVSSRSTFRAPAGSSTTRRRSGRRRPRPSPRCSRARALTAADIAGDRDHEPARDHRALGSSAPARPVAPRDRLAGPAHRRRVRARCRPRGTRRKSRGAPASLLDPYFSATKLAWLLDSDAGRCARARSAASSRSARSTAGSSGS